MFRLPPAAGAGTEGTMKKMKLLSILAAGALSLGLFAGCGAKIIPVQAASDTYIAETYDADGVTLLNAPTVVADIKDKAALDALSAEGERPSNAILRFDAEGNVVGEKGEVLGSFADIYDDVLQHRIIPVVYVSDEGAADAFISYMNETDILDIAVMSDSPDLVKKVREAKPNIRGIVEYGEEAEAFDVVKTTNASYANVAVIPQSMATLGYVTYIHARFKTVWVDAAGASDFALKDVVSSGAYGIVTDDYAGVYDVLESYQGGSDIARTPFNVAHRGLPNLCNENSVFGTSESIKAGATHVELDGQLSTDGQIFLMHDADISRTSDGSGNGESMSYDQLKSYKLDSKYPQEPIPLLTDALAVFKDSDAVMVFEIKSSKTALVTALKNTVGQMSEEDGYDYWQNIVVISFNTPILTEMKRVLPEVPAAYLGDVKASTLADSLALLCSNNMGVDTGYGNTSYDFNARCLRDRGFVGWYWTYDGFNDAAATTGYVGLTNNKATQASGCVRSVEGVGSQTVSGLSVGDTVRVSTTTYKGETAQADGEVFALEETEGGYNVIAALDTSLGRMFTKSFFVADPTVEEPDPGEPDPGVLDPGEPDPGEPDPGEPDPVDGEGGCGGTVGGSFAAGAAVLLAAGCALLCKRQKDGK